MIAVVDILFLLYGLIITFFAIKSNKKESIFQNNCAKVRGRLYFFTYMVLKLFC